MIMLSVISLPSYPVEYNTIQYNTIQYNTIQYNTIQYNTIQYNTIQYNGELMFCGAESCDRLRFVPLEQPDVEKCNRCLYFVSY